MNVLNFHIDILKETEMRGRDRKFYVLLAVFAFLFAMPANAVTISPGNAVPVLLTSGNEYVNSNLTFLGAGNVDSYKFEIASAPFGTITATLSFGNKGPFRGCLVQLRGCNPRCVFKCDGAVALYPGPGWDLLSQGEERWGLGRLSSECHDHTPAAGSHSVRHGAGWPHLAGSSPATGRGTLNFGCAETCERGR